MVKSENDKRKEKFGMLSKEYYRDQEETNRLIASIRWLLTKHTQVKLDIAKHGQKYADKLKMTENLRNWIANYLLQHKENLSKSKKSKLLKMKKRLPGNTLFDRIKLMDITECCTHQKPKNIQKWNGKSVLEIINNLEANEKKLKSIDDEMILLISDVHDLHSYIEYVKHSKVAKVKMISLLRGINWNAGKSRRNVAATPARKKPLEDISNFLPDMYHYLDA